MERKGKGNERVQFDSAVSEYNGTPSTTRFWTQTRLFFSRPSTTITSTQRGLQASLATRILRETGSDLQSHRSRTADLSRCLRQTWIPLWRVSSHFPYVNVLGRSCDLDGVQLRTAFARCLYVTLLSQDLMLSSDINVLSCWLAVILTG